MRSLLVGLFICMVCSGELLAQGTNKAAADTTSAAFVTQIQPVSTQSIPQAADAKETSAAFRYVGYGYERSDQITSAISSINVQDLHRSNYANLAEYLQGRVPGVTVTRDPNNPFGYHIQIRGVHTFLSNTEPLIVLNGIPLSSTDILQSINPNDIASVSIIKDGSAAIYGTRGANGVILINTRTR